MQYSTPRGPPSKQRWPSQTLVPLDTFVLENAPAVNKQIAVNAIAIKLPDEKVIYSTHTANLDIPWPPGNMTECQIEPGLAH